MEQLELGEDERSDAEKAADEAEVREQIARLQLGGQAQPALQSSNEAFMTGAQVAAVEQTRGLPAPAVAEQDGKVVDTILEDRERFDFSFTVRHITVQVEKKIVEGHDCSSSVCTREIVPDWARGLRVARSSAGDASTREQVGDAGALEGSDATNPETVSHSIMDAKLAMFDVRRG